MTATIAPSGLTSPADAAATALTLDVLRPDHGPCCRCKAKGRVLVRDSAEVRKPLCGRCLRDFGQICRIRFALRGN